MGTDHTSTGICYHGKSVQGITWKRCWETDFWPSDVERLTVYRWHGQDTFGTSRFGNWNKQFQYNKFIPTHFEPPKVGIEIGIKLYSRNSNLFQFLFQLFEMGPKTKIETRLLETTYTKLPTCDDEGVFTDHRMRTDSVVWVWFVWFVTKRFVNVFT